MTKRRQRSGSAVNAQCARRDNTIHAVEAPRERKQSPTRTPWSSVETPWSPKDRRHIAIFKKKIKLPCDLTALWEV